MRAIINFIILPVFFFRLMASLMPGASLQWMGAVPTHLMSDSLLMQEFSRHSVFNADFCRPVFYTWTTKKQVETLRESKVLIWKSVSETKGASLYDVTLNDTALLRDPCAALLRQEQFTRKRFAWPNAWATLMGWEDEKYGDQLIRIELRDDAIMGYLNIEKHEKPLSFFDMKGRELSKEEVLAHQDRIAAVYHVNERKARVTMYRGSYRSPKKGVANAPFREYVIVNEKMIKSWSYGDERVLSELKAESTLLKELLNYCDPGFCNAKAHGYYSYSYWEKKERIYGMEGYYISNIALVNDLYLFNKKRIKAIIRHLDDAISAQGKPISN
jgi:hypothetical protein